MRLLHIFIALLLALLIILPARCLADYVDGTGQHVAYGQDPHRIVSLMPNVTEILYFLGLGDRVVGRSDFCDYPPEVTKLPSVGGMVDTSVEQIVALKPDLVIGYQGNDLQLIGQLRPLHINVVALPEAKTLDQIHAQILQVWKLAGPPDAAEPKQLAQWEARLASLRRDTVSSTPTRPQLWISRRAGMPAPRVFYGMPGASVYTAGPGTFIFDLIASSGAVNVVHKIGQRWPQVSAEFILAAQPEWLLVSTPCAGHTELADATKSVLDNLRADPVWSKLPAVRNGHVVVIDADILLRPGPRILDALEQLEQALDGAKR